METRIAVMSIIVEDPDRVAELNALLHDYGPYIIGRMGSSTMMLITAMRVSIICPP